VKRGNIEPRTAADVPLAAAHKLPCKAYLGLHITRFRSLDAIPIESITNDESALETFLVGFPAVSNARENSANAISFSRPSFLRQIGTPDNLCHPTERGVANFILFEQGIECTATAVVTKLHPPEVEWNAFEAHEVACGWNKLESRLRIDEFSNGPSGRNPIHMYPLTRYEMHPDTPTPCLRQSCAGLWSCQARSSGYLRDSSRPAPDCFHRFQFSTDALSKPQTAIYYRSGLSATGGSEEVTKSDFVESAL
jgi:hypothetical protein